MHIRFGPAFAPVRIILGEAARKPGGTKGCYPEWFGQTGETYATCKVPMAIRLMKLIWAYLLMLTAVFVFWDILGRPHVLQEPELGRDRRLQSVSYAPFEKDQSPLAIGEKGLTISTQRIEADLAMLAGRFDGIRLYSAAGLETLPPIAEKYGLKILLGAW
jgi:hypothetical protein